MYDVHTGEDHLDTTKLPSAASTCNINIAGMLTDCVIFFVLLFFRGSYVSANYVFSGDSKVLEIMTFRSKFGQNLLKFSLLWHFSNFCKHGIL